MNQQIEVYKVKKADVEHDDSFRGEILEQADVLRACADHFSTQVPALKALRAATERDVPIVLTGMGSSYNALQALSSLLLRHGRLVSLVNTAELLHFGMSAPAPGTLVMAVSQSGRSAELVELAERSLDGGFVLAAVTNDDDNPLHTHAAITIALKAGREEGPSTKSYTATLIALSLIEAVITDRDVPIPELVRRTRAADEEAARLMSGLLERGAELGRQMLEWSLGGPMFFIGRGVGIAAAQVGALIMKEAGHRAVIGMDCAEFRHGPLELAGPDLKVVLVAIEKDVADLDARLVGDLQEAGAKVTVIGPDALGAHNHVPVGLSGAALHDVAIASVPLQMLTWAAASANSSDPGVFRVGSKVTSSL